MNSSQLLQRETTTWTDWIITKKRQLLFWLLAVAATVLLVKAVEKWNAREELSIDIHSGPWGDLVEWNIHLEQPSEYAGFEKTTGNGPFWSFGTLLSSSVHDLLLAKGCTEDQASRLLQSRVPNTAGVFVVKADSEWLLSLSPSVRSALYLELARNPANRFQVNPYYIHDGDLEWMAQNARFSDKSVLELMKGLLYTRNGSTYFSDPEVVLQKLKTEEDRSEFLRCLTAQNAVMMQLLIRPDTDIDKPLNYWALSITGVLLKDLRPLMEAEKNLPHGGSMSLLYLLPLMARERLYTSPLPPRTGDPKLPDCHWTALNFFNLTPDPRMSDNKFASQYITDHYYEIAKPGIAGDLVFLVNSKGEVFHSAVYLADDIVFTKNGINYAQPWILMHEKDMVGSFSALEPVKVAYFRQKGV